MNTRHIIQKEIENLGATVIITDGEWSSVPFKAILRPLWRKKSSPSLAAVLWNIIST